MLDKTRQIKLSHTIPVGMNELPVQIQLREEISQQQKLMAELNNKTTSLPSERVSFSDLQCIDCRIGATD